MTVFIIRRLMQSAVVVVVMSLLVFFGVYLIGNPIEIFVAPDADQIERERAIAALGLDLPVWLQYGRFLASTLEGDLGRSFVFNMPSITLILQRMPATLELATAALILSAAIGLPFGMYAGYRPQTRTSKAIMASSILGFSLPTFWVGLMLIMVFAVMLGWLPSTGRGRTATYLGITSSLFTLDGVRHVAMPAFNLALLNMALICRLARAGMREVLPMDYVKYARAKGLTARRILFAHVLKNILIPIVTVLGLEFGQLIAFSVVTETVFAWPGMGKLIIDSIRNLDRPVIVAYLVITVFTVIVINLVVDVVYSLLDPRVRLAEAKA